MRQRVSPGLVDLDTLKTLSADQSAMLPEQQRSNMSDKMVSLRDEMKGSEMKGGEAKIFSKVQAQQQQLDDFQEGQAEVKTRLQAMEQGSQHGVSQDVLDRLQKLETNGALSTAFTQEPVGAERHPCTLILGNWQQDTPRKSVVQQVHDGLTELQVSSLTDYPAFCTGPRKAVVDEFPSQISRSLPGHERPRGEGGAGR